MRACRMAPKWGHLLGGGKVTKYLDAASVGIGSTEPAYCRCNHACDLTVYGLLPLLPIGVVLAWLLEARDPFKILFLPFAPASCRPSEGSPHPPNSPFREAPGPCGLCHWAWAFGGLGVGGSMYGDPSCAKMGALSGGYWSPSLKLSPIDESLGGKVAPLEQCNGTMECGAMRHTFAM
jgi:hypothetical protein